VQSLTEGPVAHKAIGPQSPDYSDFLPPMRLLGYIAQSPTTPRHIGFFLFICRNAGFCHETVIELL
jgi:hypothetical protein